MRPTRRIWILASPRARLRSIEDDVVTKLKVSCGGSVKVLLTQASASVDADITFTDAQMPEVPDSVLSALR